MTPPRNFEISESRTRDGLRLSLAGELDIASTPLLKDRLGALRASKLPVRLNLSNLSFIDCTGLHLLVRTVGDARIKHWHLWIEPDLGPQVVRLFKLVHLEGFLTGGEPRSLEAPCAPTGRGRPAPPLSREAARDLSPAYDAGIK